MRPSKIHRHAYNLVMRWYRDDCPNQLYRHHWLNLISAVEKEYKNKNKIRGTRR